MSEALARLRNDSVLARPAKARKAAPGRARRVVGRALALPVRLYAGAAFAALLAGIAVNALVLQHERRPAPAFVRAAPHSAASKTETAPPVRSPSATDFPASPAPAAPSPPERPAAKDDAPAPDAPDPIGALLRGGAEPPADSPRIVTEAQEALMKLGYPVKADGREGAATEQALRDFERAHGLSVSTGISPRLVKRLQAAARAARR